jgi:hypothetical protein
MIIWPAPERQDLFVKQNNAPAGKSAATVVALTASARIGMIGEATYRSLLA